MTGMHSKTAAPPTDRLCIRPVTLRQARAFVQEHHRHHDAPQGGLFAIALMRGDELVGVAIAGRPVSGELQRRGWAQVIAWDSGRENQGIAWDRRPHDRAHRQYKRAAA